MSAEMIDTCVLKTAEERRRAEILKTVIISAVRPHLGQVYLSPECCPLQNFHFSHNFGPETISE